MSPKVQNMTSPRSGRSVPNQILIYVDGIVAFQSYGTLIAIKKGDGTVVLDQKYWDYSKTTGKYRNEFLGENKAETLENIQLGRYTLDNLNPQKS